MVLSTSKRQGKLSIELKEHRYYYPGDTIQGNVTINLTKPTKTLNIRLTLSAEIQSMGKSVQLLTQTKLLAQSPLKDSKAHMLQAMAHSFSFEFCIPGDNGQLPSSMKLAKFATVRYTLAALHDRPLVPDSLALQCERQIPVLEYLDVDSPSYSRKALINQLLLESPDTSRKTQLSISIPRPAIVRGDVVPVMITIKHGQSLQKDNAIEIQLLRNVYVQRLISDGVFEKGRVLDQAAINTNSLHINLVPGPQNEYTQILKTRIMVPTNTPPTVGNSGRIFGIEYLIRVVVDLKDYQGAASQPQQKLAVLTLPLVVGTFPKADLSIDEDEEDDAIDAFDEMNGQEGDNQESSEILAEKLKAINISSSSLAASATSGSLSSQAVTPSSPPRSHQERQAMDPRQSRPSAPIIGTQPNAVPLSSQGRWQPHASMAGRPRPFDNRQPMESSIPSTFFNVDRAHNPPRPSWPYPSYGYHSGARQLPGEPALPTLIQQNTLSSTYSPENFGSSISYDREQDSPSSSTVPFWPASTVTPNYRQNHTTAYHGQRSMSLPSVMDPAGQPVRPVTTAPHPYKLQAPHYQNHHAASRPSAFHYPKAPDMLAYGLSQRPPASVPYPNPHPSMHMYYHQGNTAGAPPARMPAFQ